MGNEMGNSNVTGLQEQEKTEFGAPDVSLEVPDAANVADDIKAQTQLVLSLKEEGLHEEHEGLSSEDPSGIGNLHGKQEALEKNDPDKTEVQAPDESLEVSSVSNDSKNDENGEETKPVSSSKDGRFQETISDFEKDPSGMSDHQIQKPESIQIEPDNTEVKALNGSSINQSGTNDTGDEEVQALNESSINQSGTNDTDDEEIQSSSLSEEGGSHETTPDSEKNQLETSEYQIQEQTFIGSATYCASPEMGNMDVQAPELALKASIVTNDDTNDKERHLVSSSEEDGSFYETTSDSERNPSETIDNQVQKQTLTGRGEELENLPQDTISDTPNPDTFESIDQTLDQEMSSNVRAEPCVGDGSEMQKSNAHILGSDLPHYSEDGNKLDNKAEHMLEGSVIPCSNSKVEVNDGDLKERDSLEEKLVDMRDTEERKFEMEVGDEVGMQITHLNDVEKDSGDTQLETVPLSKPIDFQVEASESKDPCVVLDDDAKVVGNGSGAENDLDDVENDSSNMQLEAISLADSLEAFQVEVFEAKDTYAVIVDDPKSVENGSGVDHNQCGLNQYLVSEQEPEIHEKKTSVTEFVEIGTSHEDKRKGIEGDNSYGVETDSQSDKASLTDNGNQVDFHESCGNSVFENNDMDLVKQIDMVNEVSTSPTEFMGTDTISEEEEVQICDSAVEDSAEKVDDMETKKEDEEEREAVKPTLMHPDSTEPAEGSATTHPVALEETQPQDAKQNPTLLEAKVLGNIRGLDLESDQEDPRAVNIIKTSDQPPLQEMECILSDSNCDHDPNIGFGSPESNDSFKTATEQENFSPMVSVRPEFSFHFDNPIAETVIPATQNEKGAETITSGSNSKVTELCSEVGNEETEKVPVIYSDVFELNGSASVTKASKVDASVGSQSSESEFSEDPAEDQTPTEKQVITLERSESQRSKTPLLSYLKEESHFAGSQRKQEGLVAKKAVEGKWNSHANKGMATSSQGREKRKPKASFFGSCMCCTAVIQ